MPVPGPARTSIGPRRWATTRRCSASSGGASADSGGVRSSTQPRDVRRVGRRRRRCWSRADPITGVGHLRRDHRGRRPVLDSATGPRSRRACPRRERCPSARSGAAPRPRGPAGGEPSARTTRCHGTPEPNRAMTVPTWRGRRRAEGRGDVAVRHDAPGRDARDQVEHGLGERRREARPGVGIRVRAAPSGRRHVPHPARLTTPARRDATISRVSAEPRPTVDPAQGRPGAPAAPHPGSSLPDFPLERTFDDDSHGTLVIEDGVIPRRVRRPGDVIRLSLAIVGMACSSPSPTSSARRSTGIEART